MRTLLTGLSLALCLSATAQQPAMSNPPQPAPDAQPAPPTAANTITNRVNLVVLDGVVIDKSGNAVTDLTRDDFTVTEDGEPQKIRNFELPGKYTPTPDITINSTADLDHLAPHAPTNIVLLDEFNTRFEDMAFARYSLKKWLEKQPDKLDTPTMLIAVNLEHFTVLRDYTQNKDEILAALDHHFVTYPWQTHQFKWVAERYATAFLTLRRVAEASLGHLGHKNMIWLGRGFPTFNRASFSIDEDNNLDSEVQQTVNKLRDARITLYTIDPAGVMIDPGLYGRTKGLGNSSPFGGDPNFQALATSTGGRNLYGRNDVDVAIGTSIRDGASIYTLTYRPTNSSTDLEKFRHIKITLDRPGLTFVTRQGYFPERRPSRTGTDGKVGPMLRAELHSAASSNMAYDAIGFTVQASPTDANALKIVVQGDGLSYYYGDGIKPRYTRIIVLSTTFDRKGKELTHDANRYTFQASASAPARGHLYLPANIDFKLTPNPAAVRARLVVRVESDGHMGTADLVLAPGASAASARSNASSTPPSPAPTEAQASTPPPAP